MPNSDSWDAYLLGDLAQRGAGVGLVRGVVGVEDLAQHEDVVAAADRVGERGDRFENAVRGVALGLVGAGTVEAPDRQFGAVGEDLGLRPQLGRRLGAVDPDVLSFVRHVLSFRLGLCLGREMTERSVGERPKRTASPESWGCSRSATAVCLAALGVGQRRASPAVGGPWPGPGAEQESDCGEVALGGGQVQRGPAVVIGGVGVGPVASTARSSSRSPWLAA